MIIDAANNKIEFELSKNRNFLPALYMDKATQVTLVNKEVTNRCPILYDECNFQGKPTEICQNIPEWQCGDIKSIFIPEG